MRANLAIFVFLQYCQFLYNLRCLGLTLTPERSPNTAMATTMKLAMCRQLTFAELARRNAERKLNTDLTTQRRLLPLQHPPHLIVVVFLMLLV
jgi:hypothetical protein